MFGHIPLIVGILIHLLSAYFAVISLFSLKRPAPFPAAAPRHRFAVVIPARNEEAVIGALVESLKKQSYPRMLYDIYVIPNNCTDRTAGAAARAGARLLYCPFPVSCKGDVLRQILPVLMAMKYDAFCVFDADNVADSDFLREMNNAFCAGERVAKGRIMARNAGDSWIAACYGIYFGFFDLFFNRARASCGLSAKLVGTGFAVHRTVLEKLGGWNTQTMAEDAEFSAQCAIAGYRVAWVPQAVTYDEQPVTSRLSLVQRKRWCSGLIEVSRGAIPTLLKACRKGRTMLRLDFLLFLLMPYARALSPLPAACALLLALLAGPAALLRMMPLILSGFMLFYCSGIVLAALIIRWSGMRIRPMLSGVFTFPLFMASWLPLQILALFHRTTVWEDIHHTGMALEKSA